MPVDVGGTGEDESAGLQSTLPDAGTVLGLESGEKRAPASRAVDRGSGEVLLAKTTDSVADADSASPTAVLVELAADPSGAGAELDTAGSALLDDAKAGNSASRAIRGPADGCLGCGSAGALRDIALRCRHISRREDKVSVGEIRCLWVALWG